MKQRKAKRRSSIWTYTIVFLAFSISSIFAITWYELVYHPVSSHQVDSKILDEIRTEIFNRLILSEIILSLVLVALAFVFYKAINPALLQLKSNARKFANGRFDQTLPSYQIKEINTLAKSLNMMSARLKHLEQVRSDFVANVSHELRTPITSIQGFVETLQDGAIEDKENAKKFLEIISRQSDRMTNIINDLLMLARLESSQNEEKLSLYEQRMIDVINDAVESCRPMAKEKNISLLVNCPPRIQAIFDRSLTEQALVNLIENAIKYSDEKSVVKIYTEENKHEVSVNINDQGPGIPNENLGRLFERFYRVDKARSRKVGGTGLGLAIVKHIAGIQNGQVRVQSELGKGSIFSIDLPKENKLA